MNRRPGYRYSKLFIEQSITLTALTTVFRTEYDGHEYENDSNDVSNYCNIDRSNITGDVNCSDEEGEEIDEYESSKAEKESPSIGSIAQDGKNESFCSTRGTDEQRSRTIFNEQSSPALPSDSRDELCDAASPDSDGVCTPKWFESHRIDQSVLSSKPLNDGNDTMSPSQLDSGSHTNFDKDSDTSDSDGDNEIKDRLYFAAKESRRHEREFIEVTEVVDNTMSGSNRSGVSKTALDYQAVDDRFNDISSSQSDRGSVSSCYDSDTDSSGEDDLANSTSSLDSERSRYSKDHIIDVSEVFDCSERGIACNSRALVDDKNKASFSHSGSDKNCNEDFNEESVKKGPLHDWKTCHSYEREVVNVSRRRSGRSHGNDTAGNDCTFDDGKNQDSSSWSNNGSHRSCDNNYNMDPIDGEHDVKESECFDSQTHHYHDSEIADKAGNGPQGHGVCSTVPVTCAIDCQKNKIPSRAPGFEANLNEAVGGRERELCFNSTTYQYREMPRFVHSAEHDAEDRCINENVPEYGRHKISSSQSERGTTSDTEAGGEQDDVKQRLSFDSDFYHSREGGIVSELVDSMTMGSDGPYVEVTLSDCLIIDDGKNETSSSASDKGSVNSCDKDYNSDTAAVRGEVGSVKKRLDFDSKMDAYCGQDIDVCEVRKSCSENDHDTEVCTDGNSSVHGDDILQLATEGRDMDNAIVNARNGTDDENLEYFFGRNSKYSHGYWLSNEYDYRRAESQEDQHENSAGSNSDESNRDALRERNLQEACEYSNGSHCFYSYYSDGVDTVGSPDIADSSDSGNRDSEDKILPYGSNSDPSVTGDSEQEQVGRKYEYREYRANKYFTTASREHNSDASFAEDNYNRSLEKDSGAEDERLTDDAHDSDEEENCACCEKAVRIKTEYGGYWEANEYKYFTPTNSDDDSDASDNDDTCDVASSRHRHVYDSDSVVESEDESEDESDMHESTSNSSIFEDGCESEEEYVRCRNEYRGHWESEVFKNVRASSMDDSSEESSSDSCESDEEEEAGEQERDRHVGRHSNQYCMNDTPSSEHELRVATCGDRHSNSNDSESGCRGEATDRAEGESQVNNVVYISDDSKETQYIFLHFSGNIVFSSCSFRNTAFNFNY